MAPANILLESLRSGEVDHSVGITVSLLFERLSASEASSTVHGPCVGTIYTVCTEFYLFGT